MSIQVGIEDIILIIITFALAAVFCYVAVVSFLEKEKRAAILALLFTLAIPVLLVPTVLIPGPVGYWTVWGLIFLFGLFMMAILFPTRWLEKKIEFEIPKHQINEKNVMFSRRLLEPGSERYREYYKAFPEHEEPDLNFRSRPGLLNKGAAFYNPLTFTAANAIFEGIHAFYPLLDGEPSPEKTSYDPKGLSRFISCWAKKQGAVSVGFTETRDYHWYSEVGRGPDFGKEARLPHTHAIAFTVEMDKEFVDTAPQHPTVMESAGEYMKAAVIATELAIFIRNMGYHARAHIDGNYRVVCPLVARDAGLGEIGRMGLLMTPRLGPRVRIGVVTTDMPVEVTDKKDMSHMIRFCRICKKCADVCPSRSISFEDRVNIDGVRRWQINQESCFTYWCIAGTDCAKCMSDCPFSHPDNLFHNAIRALLKNSSVFRRLAIKMDDLFYGRRPPSAKVPGWMNQF